MWQVEVARANVHGYAAAKMAAATALHAWREEDRLQRETEQRDELRLLSRAKQN